jgi:hypothetical protein
MCWWGLERVEQMGQVVDLTAVEEEEVDEAMVVSLGVVDGGVGEDWC